MLMQPKLVKLNHIKFLWMLGIQSSMLFALLFQDVWEYMLDIMLSVTSNRFMDL